VYVSFLKECCCLSFGWFVLFFVLGVSWSTGSCFLAGLPTLSMLFMGAFVLRLRLSLMRLDFFVLFICSAIFSGSLRISAHTEVQTYVWAGVVLFPVLIMWFISTVAETNRAPFDFVEGESELVSGFNVEYAGGGFAVLFMFEYSNVLFLSIFSAAVFFGWWLVYGLLY